MGTAGRSQTARERGPPRLGGESLEGLRLLERYVLEARIGAGGTSIVYRALDERLRRAVCVKLFFGVDRTQSSYRTAYEHFVQEAFALSQLQHPNTLRVYDFGCLETEPYSPFHVSELMPGGTLETLVERQGPFDPQAALTLLEPIFEALTEAHERGIVHRDIKPSNILLGEAGTRRVVKLADFGIAKATLAAGAATLPHRAGETQCAEGNRLSLYSPAWAAPEQLRALEVGPDTDVFALGLLVAFVVSGRAPFAARDLMELLGLRMSGDRVTAERVAALDLPDELRDVVLRACRSERGERYSSVEAFANALREAVAAATERAADGTPTSLDVTPVEGSPAVPRGARAAGRTAHPTRPEPLRPLERAPAPGRVALGDAPPSTELTPVDPVYASREAPPLPRAAPPAEARRALVTLDDLAAREAFAGAQRVWLLPLDEAVDLGGAGAASVSSEGRLRVTFLPGQDDTPRVHLRGLNCFLQRAGGRRSSAVDLSEDTTVELCAPRRAPLDHVRCVFGVHSPEHEAWLYRLDRFDVAVPTARARHAVLLDFGPGREVALVYAKR